jgi:hypothetical protein
MNTIYVMTDRTGSRPVLWSADRPPASLPGHREWRLVAKVEDEKLASTLSALHARCEAGEL